MIWFDAAPPVPICYRLLIVFNPEELSQAFDAGYLAKAPDVSMLQRRAGLNNYRESRANDDLYDWRTRMYVVWFCYIYENFVSITRPLFAIEEIILEFKAQKVLDMPGARLATLYAGAGGGEPVSTEDRAKQIDALRPHYELGLRLLNRWGEHSQLEPK